MFCGHCGTENVDGAKFCRGCGRELTHSKRKQTHHKFRIAAIAIIFICLIVVVAIGMYRVFGQDGSGRAANADESFKQYAALNDGIDSIEQEYIDENGCVSSEDIPELMDSVQSYVEGLPKDLVASYDVGEEYVQVDLSTGLTYVYAPHRENMMDRGDGMIICSYEQETTAFSDDRDEIIKDCDLRAEPDSVSVLGNSLIDSVAWYLVNSNPRHFKLDEFYDDENVTLDVIKGFGQNQLILWEGHGLWTEQLGPHLQLSQKIDNLWWQEVWGEDFWEKRLVAYGDHVAVTSAFFSHYYKAGDLQDSVIYLGSCYSLRDDRLAAILTARGASLVIGNTNSVSSFYQYQMRDSILADMADYRMPVSDALSEARVTYGSEDPWCDEGEHTKVVYFPKDAGSVTLFGDSDQRLPKKDSESQRTNYEWFAAAFIEDMYDDWTFAGSRKNKNLDEFPGRCLKRIDKDSDLYSQFVETGVKSEAEYAKDALTCVVGEPETEMLSDGLCRVTVHYVREHDSMDRELYDRLVRNPEKAVWDVTMDGACKVLDLDCVYSEHEASTDSSDTEVNSTGDISDIESQAGKPVVWSESMDFDGDGQSETFAIVGNPIPDGFDTPNAWSDGELWFISSSGQLSKVAGSETFQSYLQYLDILGDGVNDNYTFLSLENTAFGSGGTAHVYTVREGTPTEVEFDQAHVDWVRGEGGGAVGTIHVFEGIHQRQDYFFVYDESTNTFVTTEERGGLY